MSAYPEHLFGVNVKVMVSDDVSETDRACPVYLGMLGKKGAAGDPVKSSALRIRSARVAILSSASSICASMERTSSLSNIERVFLYTFLEKRVHFFAHTNDVDMFMNSPFNSFLDVHQRERIGGPRLDEDIHIAFFPGLVPRSRAEYADLKDAVFFRAILFEFAQDGENVVSFHGRPPLVDFDNFN
jgi:hypothetical protein